MVAHEGHRCCLLVDELITGGTILGDGNVALVIDVAAIAERVKTLA